MNIVQNLVPPSKYTIKCPYAMKPQYIVVHNTANDASARNEVSYMVRNNNQTSFHYAIDDKEIVQGIPDNRNAWHAGDGNGKGNRSGIGVEICFSKSGGERFDQAERLAATFIAFKLKQFGWGIERVIRHYDCSGKNCPHRTMEKGWHRFLKMIKDEMAKNGTNSLDVNGTIPSQNGTMGKLSQEQKTALKSKLKAKYGFADETCDFILAYKHAEALAMKLLERKEINEDTKRFILSFKYGKEILERVYGKENN